MIYGIGVDHVEIGRMEKSLKRTAFLNRVYGEDERMLLRAGTEKMIIQRAAACFAAKEAFLKATGQGLGSLPISEIQVLRKESGAPYFSFSGEAEEYINKNRITPYLSITHDGGLATAFVVLEQTDMENRK